MHQVQAQVAFSVDGEGVLVEDDICMLCSYEADLGTQRHFR